MRSLKHGLFPNRRSAIIAGLIVLTGAVALIRHTGLAPIGANLAISIYLATALAGAATAALAASSGRRRRKTERPPHPAATRKRCSGNQNSSRNGP